MRTYLINKPIVRFFQRGYQEEGSGGTLVCSILPLQYPQADQQVDVALATPTGKRIAGKAEKVMQFGGESVEAQTDIQTYLEQGKQALAQGQGREAAIAYAQGAQIDPDNAMTRLGLAEANLALGDYDVVRIACHDVLQLQPDSTEGKIAQALLDLLDERYDQALKLAEEVVQIEPGIAYVHALRSHLLRAQGQDYDANLARARAARLSYGGRFENNFPPIAKREAPPAHAQNNNYSASSSQVQQMEERTQEREPVPAWSRPNSFRRQVIRTRFIFSQHPGLITNILIAINIIVLILSFIAPPLVDWAQQNNILVAQGQYWRVITSVFIPAGSLFVLINLFSLFFIGRTVEMVYGPIRYLAIYILAGIVGNLLFLFTFPGINQVVSLGPTYALFGVFGALGTFYIANRRAMGSMGWSAIGQWAFWMVLNISFGFVGGGPLLLISPVGSLIVGMLIAFLLMPRVSGRWRI